jgi:hypothetical protein
VSSNHWPVLKQGRGILSANVEENPYWWNANAVSVPYCSSDVWSGNQTLADAKNGLYAFMGARIIQEVIRELLDLHDLGNATQILLVGSSVGGTGVMLNLDRVADIVGRTGSKAEVYGLSDSGWYVDNTPNVKNLCNGRRNRCSATKTIQAGQRYWKGIVPERCARHHRDNPWSCYFGDKLYKHIQRPLFVTQYLYDEEQLKLNKLVIPHNDSDYDRMLKIGKQVRKSLKKARYLFAPACLAHELVIKSALTLYKIDGLTLSDAINCWMPKPGRQESSICSGKRKLIDDCDYPSCNTQCPDVITHHGSQRYDMEDRYKSFVASQANQIGYDSGVSDETQKKKNRRKKKNKNRAKEE